MPFDVRRGRWIRLFEFKYLIWAFMVCWPITGILADEAMLSLETPQLGEMPLSKVQTTVSPLPHAQPLVSQKDSQLQKPRQQRPIRGKAREYVPYPAEGWGAIRNVRAVIFKIGRERLDAWNEKTADWDYWKFNFVVGKDFEDLNAETLLIRFSGQPKKVVEAVLGEGKLGIAPINKVLPIRSGAATLVPGIDVIRGWHWPDNQLALAKAIGHRVGAFNFESGVWEDYSKLRFAVTADFEALWAKSPLTIIYKGSVGMFFESTLGSKKFSASDYKKIMPLRGRALELIPDLEVERGWDWPDNQRKAAEYLSTLR